MDLQLSGKVALITGASRGIGAAIARELAAEGCKVMLSGRDEKALAEVAAAVGAGAQVHAADLREPAAPAALVEAARAAFGRLDVVVCCAGATRRGDFLKLSDEEWADGFALKFFAHVRLLRAAWPMLVAAKGSALIIAGAGGRTPGAEFAIGGSVNAALLSLGKALAARGIADGVQVNVVNPGTVATDRLRARIRALTQSEGISAADAEKRMLEALGTARFGEPREIASLVAFVVSPRGRYLQGAMIDVDGGQTKTL